MNKIIYKHIMSVAFCGFLALGLTACQTVDTVIGGKQTRYGCVEGSVLTLQPGYNRHHVDVTYHYDGQLLYRATLQATSSDFGERFRADGFAERGAGFFSLGQRRAGTELAAALADARAAGG